MIRLSVLVAALLVCSAVALQMPRNEMRKKLAGPPSEFAQFQIPQPISAALETSSALQEITLKSTAQGFVWEGNLPVDSSTEFVLGLFSPYADSFEVVVTTPYGIQTALHDLPAGSANPIKRTDPFGIDGATYPVTTWTWSNPIAGTWNAQLKCTAKVSQSSIKAFILLFNESPVKVFSHLNTYDLQLGQEVGVVANLYDSRLAALNAIGRPTPLIFEAGTLKAQMDVTFPDGKEFVIQMHDDGLHADLEANDGIYGAVLQAFEAGAYTARAVFTGVSPSGHQFVRSTDHLFNVLEPSITLTGLATADYKDKDVVVFHLDVDVLADSLLNKLTVKAFAEVWGTDGSGLEYTPVAWLQAMVDPVAMDDRKVIALEMNVNWMHLAQASAPFQLRNVWLEDKDYSTPYSQRSRIFVETTNKLKAFRPSPFLANTPITQEMREGRKPLALRNATAAANKKLLLVHGYCAGDNEFPLSQFTDAVQFKDFKKSRSNDEFARMIMDFATKQGITSFGIVGHSQGGLAATTLHAFYFSGLEDATGGSLIQSVGSPYGGSGLAGSLASIGGVFGVGCGSNTDLSRDGAKRWSATIPSNFAKDVDYYTTVYGSSKGYCAWGANTVLDTPNDGTTEIKWASLPGANNKGTKSDWCHTTGMTYANQCTDAARNAILNANAAR